MPEAIHANASNRRAGSNHKRWFASNIASEGSLAHWLASNASEPLAASSANLKTMRRGGSSSQLARGWADRMAEAACPDKEAAARAVSIARRMMGLGLASERVGPGRLAAAARQAHTVSQFVACAEFDSCEASQKIFCEMALRALRGASGATHLCLHSGYGQANGYRGSHLMASIADLAAGGLRAESRTSMRGASIHVFCEVAGQRHDLVSFKRKGGDGPSEPAPDQLQATLLARGALRAAAALPSTAILRDTGRSLTGRAACAA